MHVLLSFCSLLILAAVPLTTAGNPAPNSVAFPFFGSGAVKDIDNNPKALDCMRQALNCTNPNYNLKTLAFSVPCNTTRSWTEEDNDEYECLGRFFKVDATFFQLAVDKQFIDMWRIVGSFLNIIGTCTKNNPK